MKLGGKEVKFAGKTLTWWILKQKRDAFPDQYDYTSRFGALSEYMNKNIHPTVTTAAAFTDGGYLTDHGPGHIATVIERASRLLEVMTLDLSAYEVFVLLVATHMHDVGNKDGREGHELAIESVMTQLGPLLSDETVERSTIWKIAQAHGGKIGSDKDKISKLQVFEYVLGKKVRLQVLAAVLRFADELADDRTRASRYLLEDGKIPLESEVFHKYALALHSVSIAEEEVALDFQVSVQDAIQKFGKLQSEVYLLDEIYIRTMKMHRERHYCMRFIQPNSKLVRTVVRIKVFGKKLGEELSLSYRLEESGYPDENNPTIYALCPELMTHQFGAPLSGASFETFIRNGFTT